MIFLSGVDRAGTLEIGSCGERGGLGNRRGGGGRLGIWYGRSRTVRMMVVICFGTGLGCGSLQIARQGVGKRPGWYTDRWLIG